ncbi:DAK2 domain-containing protein [Klenkia marina]|uniref:DAK2 domain-containing protein n=1 Tax=Klenkia marina TaxID=1960309 RepID=UPI000B884823|nr:DAK2 domain-containing protein [Klenkia marina]
MLTALDEAAVGRWSRAAANALRASRGRLDELNVFPVPDGDTGTNLLLTAQAAAESEAAGGEGPALTRWARGAVLGARGNSGAILAQLLAGLADRLAAPGPAPRAVDGPALAGALEHAARSAYEAVAEPAEGTFLTVARSGAEAAAAAVREGREALADVVRAAADGARRALHGTTEQLEALRAAGVVDAGGAGWCVVLDALVATVTGTEPDRPPLARRTGRPHRHEHDGVGTHLHAPVPDAGSEVQFLLADSTEAAVDRLRAELGWLGDCLVVVGIDTPTGREWNVHVHVHDVGAAVEAGIRAGRPHHISVTALAPVQVAPALPGSRLTIALVPDGPAAEGAGELFAAEGVEVLTVGLPVDADDTPAVDRVRAAVREAALTSGAADLVLLPGDPSLVGPVTRAAAQVREEGRDVAVVPTRSLVQGLAAVAVADPQLRFADDVIAMTEAASATRWAEVVLATGEALTSAGRCHPGDVLGIVEGDVVVIGAAQVAVTCELLDRLLAGGGELVTLLGGRLAEAAATHLAARHPTVEVAVHPLGQGPRPLLIGVE